ncbi:LacI family DNA-binding transcriptional regulator [Demequina sp.]|uniref:LacI family DNA-binding transcriptional regulator n=1 Tax=Demequina sp. TaxID=2050685 RepID=UPI003A8BC2DD
MATIADVAREAGVSISTVSYALSGKRSIKEATRTRVMEAADRLGYQPNASARMLAANRSDIIAVTTPLHPDTDHSAHMLFTMEMTKAARAHDYDTLLLVHNDAVAGMKRSAATSLADGIIVLDVDAHDERAALARELSCPVVFIGIPADTSGLVCLDLDFEAAAALAVDRLVDAGRTHLGLISHAPEEIERESNFPLRFARSFESRAKERGVACAVAYPTAARADEPIADLLRDLPELDGLVVNGAESIAATVAAALASHGLAVPTDVSVVAAGVAYGTDKYDVPLDIIPLDATASCTAAMDLLAGMIERGDTPPQVTLLAPTYVERGSVAAAVAAVPTPAASTVA